MNAPLFASTVFVLAVGCSSSSHPAAPVDGGTGIADSAVASDGAGVTHDTGPSQGSPETGTVMDSGAGAPEAGSDSSSADGGSGQFGQPCTGATTDETSQGSCGAGLVCGTWSASGAGFCTQGCLSALDGGMTPCPSSPAGAACDLSNGAATGSLCGWSCGAPGGTCPPGLTCQAIAGGSYCQ
jgi:hypothetical protein